MAEIICVIGNKGGTGKTTLSHMQGLACLASVLPACSPTRRASRWYPPDGATYWPTRAHATR